MSIIALCSDVVDGHFPSDAAMQRSYVNDYHWSAQAAIVLIYLTIFDHASTPQHTPYDHGI
jgi:hypothetical protein